MDFSQLKKFEVLSHLKVTGEHELPDSAFERLADILEKNRLSSKGFIRQRRELILLHSYYYYHLDVSVISDIEWQHLANDLVILQDSFPEEIKQNFYDEEFLEFDASTGFDLPTDDYVQELAKKWYPIYTGEQLPLLN